MDGLERQLRQFLLKGPTFGKDVFVAPGAVVLGDVTLGDFCSVWFNAVLRADINSIVIGHHTNIQDNCVLHLADHSPVVIGNYVTIGHGAVLHACTVEDECLIGMNSTVLDGAVIGRNCLVGANALVPTGMRVPPGSMVLGSPARIVREIAPEEQALIRSYAEKYANAARLYRSLNAAPQRKVD